MRITLQGMVVLMAVLLPWVSLLVVGLLWLWQHDYLLIWLGIMAGTGMLGWLFAHAGKQEHVANKPGIEPNPNWLNQDQIAWDKVSAIAAGVDLADYPLDKDMPHKLLNLGIQVSTTVANHYRSGIERATLDVPLPYLLKTLELVSRDLRRLTDYIPLSHVVTINHLLSARRLGNLTKLYDAYRVARLMANPVNALMGELRHYLQGKVYHYTREELTRWLLENFIKGTGRYAIDLYSGALTLDDSVVTGQPSAASRQDVERALTALNAEPFRILALGQVKAGKSSLLNALFGEMKAAVDVVPLTEEITPYLLERKGIPQAIVLDTRGYAQGRLDDDHWRQLEAQIVHSDLIFMVCSATSAARQADAEMLQRIYQVFANHPELSCPPVVGVLSHIDKLRPARQWQPPYNIAKPQHPKEKAIRQAMEVVAKDLQLDLADIVPVNLQQGHLYNVDEGLVPRVLAKLDSDAQRSRYIRCLRHQQQAEYWDHLLLQARNAGTIILEAGAWAGTKTSERLGGIMQKWLNRNWR